MGKDYIPYKRKPGRPLKSAGYLYEKPSTNAGTLGDLVGGDLMRVTGNKKGKTAHSGRSAFSRVPRRPLGIYWLKRAPLERGNKRALNNDGDGKGNSKRQYVEREIFVQHSVILRYIF